MALGESKSGNLQSKAMEGNAQANKAMRDASAEQISAAKEAIELAKELGAEQLKNAEKLSGQAEYMLKKEKEVSGASVASELKRKKFRELREQFNKKIEDHQKKAEKYSDAAVGFEEDILALREKNKKVSESQGKVNVEISNQMTGSMGKFKDMVESLPLGKIVSQQANLGGLMETTQKKVTASLNQSFKDGEGGIKAYAKAGQIAMNGLGMAIRAAMGPLGLIALLIAAIVMIIKHAIKATDQARKFSKELGVAADEGARLQSQFGTFNGEKAIVAMTSMNETLGYNTRLSQESADAMGVFMNHASMSNENLGKIAGNAALIGSDFAQVAKYAGEFASETTGELDILKEIASLSKDTVGHFVGRTKEMVRQAKLAKDMNLSLEKTMSVSKGLLDIESSIEAEMTARVLTGKELNFDAARQLALQGDSAGAVKEITDQVGSLEGMDMIQLESLAQASGLSVGELQGTAQKGEDKEKGKLLEAATATTMMKDVMQEIKDRWMQKISKTLDKIIGSQLFQDISAFVVKHLDTILIGMAISLAIIAAANVVGAIGRLGRGLGKGFKGMKNMFKKTGGTTVKNITKTVAATGAKTTAAVSNTIASTVGNSKNVAKAAKGGNIFTRAYNKGKNIVKSVVKKGKNVAGKVYNTGKNVVKKGVNVVKNVAKKMNPKTAFKSLFKGKTFSLLKKFMKGSGILNILMELAEVGMIMASDMPKKEKSKELVRAGAGAIGGIVGMSLGTVAAGPIGSILGSIGGGMLGNWIGSMPAVQDTIAPVIEGLLPDDNGKAEDFIVQDNKLTKFRKDDVIIGGTNLGGDGGKSGAEIVDRLDRLIELMIAGKTIEMDGTQVAKAMALNNIDIGVA